MAPNERSFGGINGVPTMYIRGGSRRPATFSCTYEFYDSLVAWVQRLRSISAKAGYGDLDFITSAGAYVDKTGEHGKGTAFDTDEIAWAGGRMCRPYAHDHASSNIRRKRRYFAVDAVTRVTFRWVLNGHYNAIHEDHIHQDFGGMPPVLSTGSGSDTFFIQAVCNAFCGAGLAIDGVWGPKTQKAYDKLLGRVPVSGDPMRKKSAYVDLLDAIALHGFAGDPI